MFIMIIHHILVNYNKLIIKRRIIIIILKLKLKLIKINISIRKRKRK